MKITILKVVTNDLPVGEWRDGISIYPKMA